MASTATGRQARPGTGARFDQRGGDSFAWAQRVSGTAGCDRVALLVNGRPAGEVAVADGRFEAEVPIGEGPNRVEARCPDGATSAPLAFTGRLTARPTARVRVAVDGQVVTLDGAGSDPAEPDGAEVAAWAWSPDPAHPAALATADGEPFGGPVQGPELRLRAPDADGEYLARLTVTDAKGRQDTATACFAVEGGRARAVDPDTEHPRWVDSAVVYAPVPALWGDDGPAAVERHLPYLKELGVDALWLWPPADRRAPGQHYAITDPFALDPSWGPPAAFASMVAAAHTLGLRVLVDVVPNHLSVSSPWFADAQANGPASHYWGFFDRDGDGRPTHYFDWDHLPNLDYGNPEVRRMVTEALARWVREEGVDGFRVDAAWAVQDRRPGFWPELRRELKRINPDLLLLAEGSATDPYFFANGFDAAYDWTDEPGHWAWDGVFDVPDQVGRRLRVAVPNHPKGYAPGAIVLRFLNNNDTGERFVDRHGPGITRVAAVLQLTLPGLPALFAGDEVGAGYLPYADLAPVDWTDRHGLRPLYRRLIELRHRVPALTGGDLELLDSAPGGSFAYLRPAPDPPGHPSRVPRTPPDPPGHPLGVPRTPPAGGQPVLVVLNFAGPAAVELSRTPRLDAALGGRAALTDLLGGRPVRLEPGPRTVTVRMGATSAHVLVPEAG